MPAPTQIKHTSIGGVDVSSIILHRSNHDLPETMVFLNGKSVEGLKEFEVIRGGNVLENHEEMCKRVRQAVQGG